MEIAEEVKTKEYYATGERLEALGYVKSIRLVVSPITTIEFWAKGSQEKDYLLVMDRKTSIETLVFTPVSIEDLEKVK